MDFLCLVLIVLRNNEPITIEFSVAKFDSRVTILTVTKHIKIHNFNILNFMPNGIFKLLVMFIEL